MNDDHLMLDERFTNNLELHSLITTTTRLQIQILPRTVDNCKYGS
jgi:hypothetical protein